MVIGILIVDFHLHGCHSLKEKRSRLRRIKDIFGKQTHVAVCESDHQDNLKISQWSFVAIATDKIIVEQILTKIDSQLQEQIDAVVTQVTREFL